ncbi:MAG: PFL family protein [Clostridiales bacterium]|nr:PFL family protein [Clostridiales bacterium]MCF8021481.1 PFL family protein [Clostridiales bacterium]
MFSLQEIVETSKMFQDEKLDIRTITMGINLRDCADSNPKFACQKIYDKVTSFSKNLVKEGENISKELGIPVVNKRISVTPISIIAEASNTSNYLMFADTLDRAAKEVGVNFIGGFSALVHKGITSGDKNLISCIPQALASTERVCSSINVATTKSGINMDAVYQMGHIIKETAQKTEKEDGLGCAKLVAFANVPEDNPFMAGAFHGIGEAEAVINVGISGPGVIQSAVDRIPGTDFGTLAETIKKTAFKITRMGELVGQTAASRLDVPFGIIDISLAPTPSTGDSVAETLESMGLESCGTHGTTAALALLNDAVKKGGAMGSSYVGGLSGAFIPVSEDTGMIEAVENGSLGIDKLEAMTCVCSVGLDMIAVPGNTSPETLAAILADEVAIGVINQKTTALRIIPAPGKKEGEYVEFGGLLGKAPIMPTNKFSSAEFVRRGGRIPAPIHSLKN